ncbi:MAG: helix-turn-helix domain-containing protein [Clostridia bacterium]|nr:helix-turn-helix domain-containing protein [Clostridia bacterium]
MRQEFYTVDELKTLLNLHEKTIQRYMREGKLKATKVGKSWRVTQASLDDFMEISQDMKQPEPRDYNAIKVSSVVDIEVKDTQEAIKLANVLTATMNSKDEIHGKTSMNIQFIETENKIRIMLYGNVKFTEDIMSFLSDFIDQNN